VHRRHRISRPGGTIIPIESIKISLNIDSSVTVKDSTDTFGKQNLLSNIEKFFEVNQILTNNLSLQKARKFIQMIGAMH
jgi:hypothetical protein